MLNIFLKIIRFLSVLKPVTNSNINSYVMYEVKIWLAERVVSQDVGFHQ